MNTTPPPVNTDVLRKVSRVYSPSAPVNDLSLFAGRQAQLAKIIEALSQRGQHVIIFGERGVGKTSLANVIPTAVRQEDQPSFVVATVNCDGADTFDSIWNKVYREIHLEQAKTQIGFNRKTARYPIALSDLLPPPESPEDVRYALTNIVNSPTLVVLDELDRLKEEAAPPTTFLLADTIKTLSDHSVPVTLILVGVADSVDKLIAGHQSIERALVQVLMPRMDREELEAIVKSGLKILALGIEPPVLDAMVGISRGFPYYVHALAYHAACYALTKDLKVVDFACLGVGISEAVANAQRSLFHEYETAVGSGRSNSLYQKVLIACALAGTDSFGYFNTAAVREALNAMNGRHYEIRHFSRHLTAFCHERGPVLTVAGRKRLFRFANPLLEPYVMLHALATGQITWDTLTRALGG